MARPTVAELLERIEALEAEVEALKQTQVENTIQYVKEVRDPQPLSTPINFQALIGQASAAWSYYREEDELGYHRYL